MNHSIEILSGRRLGDGAYTLVELIGSGTFGDVYRADQPALQREVVVKILHRRFRGEGTVRDRFLREARLASRFDHPYAAHIYDFGIEEGTTPWIAMEMVRGPTLAAYQARHGRLTVEQLVPLFDRICEVVEDAHQCGLVHRDLKPANIMILERGGRLYPKLVDFGLAKVWSQPEPDGPGAAAELPADSMAGELVGSPTYMSPEQWTQQPVGPPSDVYALAVVVYQCLTGRPPFRGETIHEMCGAHLRQPFPALPEPFPPELSAVLARAAAKEAGQRFASATGFARALRVAAGVEGGDAEEAPVPGASVHRAMAEGPQPIAEAAAALVAARGIRNLRNAMREVYEVACRYLAALALACLRADRVECLALPRLQALTQRAPTPTEWLELLAGLAPHCGRLPELAAFLREPAAPPGSRPSSERSAEAVERELEELDAFLARIDFTARIQLVVPRAEIDAAEVWMGVRPLYRNILPCAVGPEMEGKPMIMDRDGRLLVSLWPFAQIGAPAPEAVEEVFLIFGPGSPGRSEARLVASPQGFERYDASIWSWLRSDRGDGSLGGSGDVEPEPYLGLVAYTTDDARRYVGREQHVALLANRLRAQPLLVITGPSGAGKSSFVQAGLLPALAPRWRGLVVRPGATPLHSLAERLSEELGDALDVRPSAEGLRADPGSLARLLGAAARQGGTSIVLVVDQMEEIFTLCHDATERAAFAAAVAQVGARRGEPLRAILLVRDDFLTRLESFATLRDRMGAGLHLLTSPSPEELTHILVELARRARFDFEEGLASEMVAEVAGRPGALALLSFAAARLWELRDASARKLTRVAFEQMGGVSGALARHADEVLARIPESRHALVREVFRQLVTAEGTRAPMGLAELRRTLSAGAADAGTADAGAVDAGAADGVVDQLIAARLLVVAEEGRVEIVHETLLPAWPRLVAWRRDDLEGARFRDQLRAAASSWQARGRRGGMLWRGEALLDYDHWRRKGGASLTGVERDFVAASLRDARRGTLVRRGAAAAAVLLMAVVVTVLWQARATADRQRELAARNQVAAEKLVDYLLRELRGKLEKVGRLDLLAGLGNEVASYYENAAGSGAQPAVLRRRADALEMLGRAEQTAGKDELAAPRIRASERMYETLLEAQPGDLELWRKLCAARMRLGDLASRRSDLVETERLFALTFRCLEQAIAAHPREAPLHRSLALLRWRQALAATAVGRFRDAPELYRRGRAHLADATRLGGSYAGDEGWLAGKMALLARASGRHDEAVLEAERAVAAQRRALLEAADEPERSHNLAASLSLLARMEQQVGLWDAARRHVDEAVARDEAMLARDPSNLRWHDALGIALSDRCRLVASAGDGDDAQRHCDHAMRVTRAVAAAAPEQRIYVLRVADSAVYAGELALARGDLPAARALAEEATRTARFGSALAPRDLDVLLYEQGAALFLGRVELAAGRGPEAIVALRRGIAIVQELGARAEGNVDNQTLAEGLLHLGDAERLVGGLAAAAPHHLRALALAHAQAPFSPASVSLAVLLAQARLRVSELAPDPVPLRRSAELTLLATGEHRLDARGRALLRAVREGPR